MVAIWLQISFNTCTQFFKILRWWWWLSPRVPMVVIPKHFWQNFEKKMTTFWQIFEKNIKILSKCCQNVDKMLTKCWQIVDNILSKFWQNFIKCLTKCWQNFVKIPGINRQESFRSVSILEWWWLPPRLPLGDGH